MKKKIFIFDWKRKPESRKKAIDVFSNIKKVKKKMKKKIEFIIAPPTVYLDSLSLKNKNNEINISSRFSKNISSEMLKDFGINYCIFNKTENNFFSKEEVIEKIDSNINVILYVGEEKRDLTGQFADKIKEQLIDILMGIDKKKVNKIIIVYKPKWIDYSKEKKINRDVLEQSILLIKKELIRKYKKDANKIKIIYGGPVSENNILELSTIKWIDGFVFDYYCMDVKILTQIIKNFNV